jgi:integrase
MIRLLARTSLADRPLTAVRATAIQAWISELSQRLAPSTLRQSYGWLRSVLSSAIEDRLLATNPCPRRPTMLAKSKTKVVPHDRAGRAACLSNADRYRALVVVQAALGLRVGELLALRLSDVDFLKRTVYITRALHPNKTEFGPTKTEGSIRSIPLPVTAAQTHAEHIRATPPRESDGLFTTLAGKLLTHSAYLKVSSRRSSGLACRLPRPATTSGITMHRSC